MVRFEMRKIIISSLALIALLIAGCTLPKMPGKNVVCPPPPPQNCRTLVWHGIDVDTSKSYREIADKYYLFSPVYSLNTSDNEWSLAFIDRTRAVLTFDDEDIQTMMIAKFTTDTKAVFESGIGTPFESSNGAISIRDNKVVIAASSDPADSSELIGNSNLYTAVLHGNMIKNVKYMGDKVHKDVWSWESHPTISKDGNVVFFASDRNIKNGTDIFFSVRLAGNKWSEPLALNENINTDCEEITPFLTEDGKALYFSSCGHETVGGYDIFVSNIKRDFWTAVASKDMNKIRNAVKFFSKARNLKPPLNTVADEIFPSSPEDPKNILFYSSNQASAGIHSILFRRGGFDIYRRRLVQGKMKQIVKQDRDINININSPEVISKISTDIEFSPTYKLKGTVYNEETHEPVPYADVIIKQLDGDKETIEREHYLDRGREVDISSQGGDKYFDSFKINADEKGDYEVVLEKDRTYQVTAQKEDMFFDSFKTRIEKEDPRVEIKKDLFVPPALTLRINFPVDQYKRPYKYTIDTNGIETNQMWKEAIDLLAQNLLISKDVVDTLVLIGHTDDQGRDKYNYKLGLNRVKFIIGQLVKRGVPRGILVGKSAGESELLPRRTGESKKMWRKRCRRVELQKILKK